MNDSEQKIFFSIWVMYLIKRNDGNSHSESRYFRKEDYITSQLIDELGIYDPVTTFNNLNRLNLFKGDITGRYYIEDKFFQIVENIKRDNDKTDLVETLSKFVPSVEINLVKIL